MCCSVGRCGTRHRGTASGARPVRAPVRASIDAAGRLPLIGARYRGRCTQRAASAAATPPARRAAERRRRAAAATAAPRRCRAAAPLRGRPPRRALPRQRRPRPSRRRRRARPRWRLAAAGRRAGAAPRRDAGLKTSADWRCPAPRIWPRAPLRRPPGARSTPQPEEAQREAQRLQALEATLAALREQTAQNQRALLELRSELAEARESRYRNPLVYALIALLLLALLGDGAAVAPGAACRRARLVGRGAAPRRGRADAAKLAARPARRRAGPGLRADAARRDAAPHGQDLRAAPSRRSSPSDAEDSGFDEPAGAAGRTLRRRPGARRSTPRSCSTCSSNRTSSFRWASTTRPLRCCASTSPPIPRPVRWPTSTCCEIYPLARPQGRLRAPAAGVRARLQRRRAGVRAFRRGGRGLEHYRARWRASNRNGPRQATLALIEELCSASPASTKRGIRSRGLPGTAAALCGGQGSDRSRQRAARAGHAALLRRHLHSTSAGH